MHASAGSCSICNFDYITNCNVEFENIKILELPQYQFVDGLDEPLCSR